MPFDSPEQKEFLRRRKPKLYKEFLAKEKQAGGRKAYLHMSKKAKEDLRRGYRTK